jgi:thioredoxin-related protein
MLRESFTGSDFSPWLKQRFDAIELSTRGDREVVFNEDLTVTEKELATVLGVTQTPSMIFLDAQNKAIARSDGYRTPKDFKRLLDYVDSKSYLKMNLTSFIERTTNGPHYTLRSHPRFEQTTDLSRVSKPLVIVFEDSYCDACDLMHDTLFKNVEVNALMSKMTVVRLDAAANTLIVTPQGERTTAKKWASNLKLNTRPSIVIFDGVKERVRIAGVLRRYHFQVALRYMANGHHLQYATVRDFSRAWRERLLAQGKVIDVGVQ